MRARFLPSRQTLPVSFRRDSLLYRLTSLLLTWAMIMGILPAPVALAESRAEWVNAWKFEAAPPDKAPAPVRASEVLASGAQAGDLYSRVAPGMRRSLSPAAALRQPLPTVAALHAPILSVSGNANHALLSSPFLNLFALPLQATGDSQLQVSVGFADNSSASANFPEPWNESNPLVNFIGGGTVYRAGAIRLDNPSGLPVTVDSVKVDLGRPGPVFQLWQNVTVPAGGSAILTQTQDENFNTSASPIAGCGLPLTPDEIRIPKITVTVAGSSTDYADTAHVLDTGGFDSSCRGNQSLEWRPIGTAGMESPAGSIQLITDGAPHAVGTQDTVTVQLNDAGSQPLANAVVKLSVLNGPNAGKSFTGTTDSSGAAVIQYSSAAQGNDLIQASVNNVSGGTLSSQQASTAWSSADACAAPANPSAAASRLIYVGQNSVSFGDTMRLAVLLSDGTGNPLSGRSISFTVAGHTSPATTDGNGTALVTASNLPVGQSTVNISFAGDAGYQAAQLSVAVTVLPAPTLLRYTGSNLVTALGQQQVSAVLTNSLGTTPVAGRTVTFTLNGTSASAVTNASGSATATLNFATALSTGAGQLQINFAGDANYRPSSRTAAVQIYQPMPFVLWGGNSGGLRIGQRVNFWGSQWESQVINGQYFASNPSFKGWSGALTGPIQQCQQNVTPANLTSACWDVKPGQSFPPDQVLPSLIEVIVSTVIDKSGSDVFGNIACGAVLQVDHTPPYGAVPGQPGFGTIVAVSGDCAGVFPAPAVLAASQQQTPLVLPNQGVAVNYNIRNNGATDATGVVLSESFDQATPASGTANIGTISAGAANSGSFQITIPGIGARQGSESSVDYQSRLATQDGRLFTSQAEATFSDIFSQIYAPVDFSSFSQLTLPRLSVGVSGSSCIAPGTNVPYQVLVENGGSATATHIAATLTLPDGTTATPAVSDLTPGTRFAGTVNWLSPGIAGKLATESTQDYLARLHAADGVTLPAAVFSSTWQDTFGNAYGPVEQPFIALTQRIPVVSTTVPATQLLLPNQAAQFTFNVANSGSGNAVQVTLDLRGQDGTIVTAPNFSLPGGQSAPISIGYRAPSVAAKGATETDTAYTSRLQSADNSTLNLDAMLRWTDPAHNNYGPTDNPFTATEQLPILNVALDAPATATSGDTITYTITLTNIGHAAVSASNIAVTMPDGSVQHPTAAQASIAPGVVTTATATYVIPRSHANGSISATASVTWKDANANTYGPLSASATTTVRQLNQAPVVSAGPNQTVPFPNVYPLQGSVTDDGFPNGVLISTWTQLSGPPTAFADPHNPQSTVNLNAAGTYVFQLTGDDTQLQSSAQVTITTTAANLPPIVNAGPNQILTLPVNIAAISGSATDDGKPAGSALSFLWVKVAGPGIVTFANATSPATTAAFSNVGTYILRLSAFDSELTGSAEMRVTVLPQNNPPLVNAGPDQTITLPVNIVSLSGTASDDGMPAGSVLKTSWSLASGPGAVLFGDPAALNTTATFTAPGTYVLRLTADDSQFRSSDDLTVTVIFGGNNQPPHIISQPVTQFTLDPAAATPQIQDLSTWQVIDYSPIEESQGPSRWVLDGTKTIATQTLNADPSILLSNITLSNDTMDGTWAVNTTSDDDYIGFVFGFQDNQHFYLFDWKKADQNDALGFAQRGMSVKVVNASTPLGGRDFWPSGGNAGRVQTIFHNTIPWVSFTNYRFTLTFRAGQFNITVLQGSTVLASITLQDSTYTSGKFGFYNYSQDTVVYSGFQRTPLQQYVYNVVATDLENDPISYLLVNGPTGMKIDPATGVLTWAVGSGDVGPHPVTVKALEPTGLFDTQSYTLTVLSQATVSPFGSIALSPSQAGPVVVGTTQQVQATLVNGTGAPVPNTAITFRVSGANITVGSATTAANGKAIFTYTGTLAGVDSVVASAVTGTNTLNSNTSTINWVVPAQPISTTTVNGLFFRSNDSGPFNTLPTATPAFTQNFPTINFNPPTGTVPGMPGTIGVNVTTDLNGNFTGSIVAQGNGLQAGVGALNSFQAVFTGAYTVATAGDVTFSFFSDDGFVFGVSNGATRVSGSLFNPPPSGLTPFQSYPVMGAFNTATAPVANNITVHFPAAGTYPYEIDYSECCSGELAVTMATNVTGGHGVAPSGAITLTPGTNFTSSIGQSATFNALLTDASGAIIPNTPVVFNIAGANQQQFQGVSDATGKATFTYRGFKAGTDIIQAQAQLTGMIAVSNQTLITWNNAVNAAPVVNAGTSQTITLPNNAVNLIGTATDDGLPSGILTTAWSQVSGPGTAFIETPNQLSTLVTLPQAGTYVFKLTASDSLLSSSSNVTVTVNQQNLAPSISISVDSTVITQPANAVHVTGTITDDGLPIGSTVTAQWSVVSSPAGVVFSNPNSANTTITFAAAGTYTLKLTASDGALSSSVTVNITVNPPAPNQAPVVTITASQNNITLPSNAVNLAAKVVDDGLPVGGAISLQWSEVSGPLPVTFSNPANVSTQVGFPTAGVYVLQLAASDSQLTGTARISITVNAAGTNQAPTVAIIADTTALTLPNNIATLTSVVNDDGLPNGSVTTQWSQVSGPAAVSIAQATPSSVKVAFPVAGIYVIKLTASDGQLSSSASISITVTTPGGNQPPTVSAGPNQTIQLPQTIATLNGFAADDGLPTGSVLGILWSQISGPATVTFSSPNTAVTQATFTVAGTYVLQLRASDTLLVATAQVTVTVRPAFVQPPPPPVVSVAGLIDGQEITKPTPIIGSVSTGAWKLEYSLLDGSGNPTTFVTFASGVAPVTNATLGTFDPTVLLNGQYIVRFSSTDNAGQTSSTSSTVDVSRSTKVGNFTLSFNDLTVPTPSLPITITRTYDSRDKRVGDFGVGWSLSVADVRIQKTGGAIGSSWEETQQWSGFFPTYCLQSTKNHTVSITFPDGKIYKFQAVSSPQCQQIVPITNPQFGFSQVPTGSITAGATLLPVGDVDFLLDGGVPGPVNIFDFDLNLADYKQFQLITAEGFKYSLDLARGVTSVIDPRGNQITINASGITNSAGASAAFTRDAAGRITTINDPAGHSITYTYSAAGDLASMADGAGNTTTFSYDSTHLLTDIRDPRGISAVRNTFDDAGRLVSTTDPSGNTTTFTHDIAANRELITNRLGDSTLYEYDDDGNVVRLTDPLGNVTSATYDANDNRLTETDALGKTTRFTYDASGNMLTQTDPLGRVTSFTYNANRQILTSADAAGHVVTNIYDSAGNLLTTKDALGNTSTYTRTNTGLPLTIANPAGALTTYQYNAEGFLTQKTDSFGNIASFTYDESGNKLTQSVKRTRSDGVIETLTTQYQYDADNRLTKLINPDGTNVRMVYNNIGKPSDTIDALGRTTHYDYDTNGRLSKTTYPDGTSESISYDAEDHRLTTTDRAGCVTLFAYDKAGHLVKTTYPDGASTQVVYSAIGQPIKTIDALGNITQFTYDDAGQRTSAIDALSHTTTFAYDSVGNQTAVTDARGNITQFVYDSDERPIKTVFPDGTSASIVYDAAGRQISATDQAGKTKQFGYDALSRLTSIKDALGQVTRFAYDELGNRISQTDANGHVTSYVYDQLGHRTSRKLPLGMSESYAYDAVGNLISRTDFNGHTTSYGYDSLNRLTAKVADPFFASSGTGAAQVTYTYTLTGKRASMTDGSGVTTYAYDDRDRLLTKSTPLGALTYTYDAMGNMLSLKSSHTGGASMSYSYDALNRLASVTDAAGVTSYNYDAVGNLTGFTYPNNVATTYTYDTLNRLNLMQSKCGAGSPGCGTAGTTIASYGYTLGAAGNRLSVAELGTRTVQYSYDALYRLTSETIAGASGQNGTISYAYDAVGNRLQQNSTVPAVPASLLAYDENDRITTQVYDANGNTLSDGFSNVYDFENHLVQRRGVTIVYDGDGNRVSKTVAGVTTGFLVADLNPTGFPQVVEELQNGSVVRSYSFGLELIDEHQTIAGTPATSFYGYDGHGSVRFLTNASGAVTDTYDYDAFGNIVGSTGSTPNLYLFAGEQFDPDLGLYYNRARYLDVRLGRFLGMDVYEGTSQDPVSLHKYLYASNNPVSLIDPSGNEGLADSLASFAISTTLDTLAISVPFRALQLAWKVYHGASLGAAAQEAALDVVTDVALSLATAGLLRYAKGFTVVRAAGEALTRVASSVWNLSPFARGWAIEELILGGARRLHPNFPVIDDFLGGVATSIKSLDLTAATYQSASALTGRLSAYAAKLSAFQGAKFAGTEILAAEIKEKVLVVAFEEGAATFEQAKVLEEFLRLAKSTWPDIKVVFSFVP
jgi:RHS repeat-associated protein